MAETTRHTAADVSGETFTVPFLIDGEDHLAQNTFDVTNPATGKVVHRCSAASEADARKAVDAAARAFRTWRNTAPGKRRDIFLRAGDILQQRRDELAGYIMVETGCPREWADFNLDVGRDFILDIAGRLTTVVGTFPPTQDEEIGALVLKEPYGVVLGIAPWNAPYILGTRAVAFPVAAGNTAILKGSEMCPRVMWGICSVFKEAGLPAGVMNFISHAPSDAPALTKMLIEHPEVKKINFTGSTAVGRIIGRLAGENLKPVLLELGGKSPAIVWEDADLDNAALQCALGAFLNSGQICMSTERILVHKNIRAEFEKKLLEATKNVFGGPQVLISGPAAERNRRLLGDAVSKGARLLGGDPGTQEENNTRLRPIVVSGVTPGMDLYRTESFGPMVSLFEIETEEEALRIANDTDYGLSAAVFTEDLRRGLRLARSIESGAVHINSMTVHDESALPHGGIKSSGFGRFNAAGIEEWVHVKTVTFKY